VPLWSEQAEQAERLGERDSSGVGNRFVEPARVSVPVPPSFLAGEDLDMPQEPFADQRRPPCRQPEVEIRGGCWLKIEAAESECLEVGYAWRWGCYVPSPLRPRPATSGPP
jgi:hypothetical protein